MDFILNERLEKGGFSFGMLGNCRVLLKNNSHFLWFILVPETQATEIHQLSQQAYDAVNSATRTISSFIHQHSRPEKINVGNIGNIVRQMHIHVIGRQTTDPAWPGVVWSCSEKQPYLPAQVDAIRAAYNTFLAAHPAD